MASTLTEIKNPTGWFRLTVVNQGGAAANFNVCGDAGPGSPISLPASCPIPSTLVGERAERRQPFHVHLPPNLQCDPDVYALAATVDGVTNAVTVGWPVALGQC